MRLLLDENVPRPMTEIVRILLNAHEVVHVLERDGWRGTKDVPLYEKARDVGFHAVLTNDGKQMQRPNEVAAIARSGLHRIQYNQNNKHGGLVGLGAAIATVCAALPHAMEVLEEADGQRLVSLTGVDPTRRSRLQVKDPVAEPPKFWPGAGKVTKQPGPA